MPLAVSTFGAWHPEAIKHITEMAKLQAANVGRLPSVQIKRVFQKLAIVLMKGNGTLLITRSPNINEDPDY